MCAVPWPHIVDISPLTPRPYFQRGVLYITGIMLHQLSMSFSSEWTRLSYTQIPRLRFKQLQSFSTCMCACEHLHALGFAPLHSPFPPYKNIFYPVSVSQPSGSTPLLSPCCLFISISLITICFILSKYCLLHPTHGHKCFSHNSFHGRHYFP